MLCFIWGATWLGIKFGIESVPPLLFAGTRFFVAGAVLMMVAANCGEARVERADWLRVAAAALLMISLCYGSLYWGMLYLESGTAAMIELSVTPVALLAFALLLRDEVFAWRKLIAIGLGLIGLIVLLDPLAGVSLVPTAHSDDLRLLSGAAIAFAAITAAWGSVIARPLLARYPAAFIAGLTNLIGGLVLLAGSLVLEPEAPQALAGNWGAKAWSGWAFLVVFGSLIGFSLYMQLLRDIGASKAGMFAFVSPIVAMVLGVIFAQETVDLREICAMAILLSAAWIAMRVPEEVVRQQRR